jgi:hypothetical protein
MLIICDALNIPVDEFECFNADPLPFMHVDCLWVLTVLLSFAACATSQLRHFDASCYEAKKHHVLITYMEGICL